MHTDTSDSGRVLHPWRRWLARNGISPAFGYKLLKDGRAPRTVKIGSRRFVTTADAEKWARRLEREAGASR